jgi:hypothetical protein
MYADGDGDEVESPGVRETMEDALDATNHSVNLTTHGLREGLEDGLDAVSGQTANSIQDRLEETMDRASQDLTDALPTVKDLHKAIDGKLAGAIENAQRLAFRDNEAQKAAPEAQKAAPEAKKAAPEAQKAAPEAKKAAPEAKNAAPEAKKAAPEAQKVLYDEDEASSEEDETNVVASPSPPPGLPENAARATFVFFSNTQQESRAYSCCAKYANAVATRTRKYDHTTTVIFGGDSADSLDGSGVGRWVRWVNNDEGDANGPPQGIGPTSSMSALRSDGHVSMLGARDASMVRLMPYLEVPPLNPAAERHGGGGDRVRERMIRALRARTLVSAPAWETYNLAVEAAFADIQPTTGADELNAMAFCKLALLTNETMGPMAAPAGAAVGLVPSFIRIATMQGTIDAAAARDLVAVVRRCVMWGPNEQEVAAERAERAERGAEGVGEWTHQQVVQRTALRLQHTVSGALVRGIGKSADGPSPEQGEPPLVAAMRAVVAALHAWVSPGGSMFEILTATGSLVHVEEGTSAYGAQWRVAASHAGTAATGTEAHTLFAGECLYKLPIGYDAARLGGILWGAPATPLALGTWAATLNDQYRHMVTHVYKCAADGDLRGMAYVPEEGTVRVGVDHRAPQEAGLVAISYEWTDLLAILCTLGGGGRHGESTGPLHATDFGVPGGATGKEPAPSDELAEYGDTPTLWLIGAHSHPTADRTSSPYVDAGHKVAVRVDTHLQAPSFAVAIATDCDDLANDLARGLRQMWTPSSPLGVPDFVSSTNAAERLATDPLFPPDVWDSLVVGPVVQHVGADGARTRARVLLWRNNRLRADDCTCVFVAPSLVDALPCAVGPRGFPLYTILAGVLVVPFVDGEAHGMGERVRLSGDRADMARLTTGVEARTTDVDFSDPTTLVRTTVVDFDDDFRNKAACMGYCVSPSDAHCGLRLGVRLVEGGGWSFVCQ